MIGLKRLSCILVASFIFTIFLVNPKVQAILYDEGPTINLESIKVTPKDIGPNERVTISMEVTDNDSIELVTATFKSKLNINKLIKLTYNSDTHLYEGSLLIKDDFDIGEWTLYEIYARDSKNEVTKIYADYVNDSLFRSEDLTNHSFFVQNTNPLSVDVSSISVTRVLGYDNLLDLSFKINNPELLGSRVVRVGFMGPEEENSLYPNIEYFDLYCDDEGNVNRSRITEQFTEKHELGEWKLISISLVMKDPFGSKVLYDTQYSEQNSSNNRTFGTAELSAGNLILQKRVSGTPMIDVSSVQIDKTVYSAGDTLEISVKPIQGAEILNQIGINYFNKETNENIQFGGYYDANQKKYIIQSSISSDIHTGDWVVDSVLQYKEDGSISPLYNSRLYGENHYDFISGNLTIKPYVNNQPTITYSTHIQSYGWQNFVENGQMSGTSGEAKRLEAIKIQLKDISQNQGEVQYKTHVQTYGWQNWVSNGQISGTSGEGKRLEAIQIQLTGEIASAYDIYYRVHAQTYGWLDWAKNGQSAGTSGLGKRLEGIEVKLVPKGESAPGSITKPFIQKEPTVSYSTHVQTYGWQGYVENGQMSGTSGQAKRLEAIKIQLRDLPTSGGVQYKTHVQTYGWQNWASDGRISGTSGEAKRLEAIQIQLTGDLSKRYDIYYRVHVESYGWLDWAKNGQSSGTEGKAKRLEGIEIKIVPKGNGAPGNTTNPFIK
ncbi:hypothetical protein [Fredinandcohnia onubensis]|uniref:hypothetical protein n=1 Tax=Fredinandcohnia onubensis TaxID=1571209 RepID=UPI0015D4D79A|nr:hypothetical protein [Fredinandcohnia onubensis]